MNRKNIGSSFDSWLIEEGIHAEVTATALKRVLRRQEAKRGLKTGARKLQTGR